MIKNRSPTKKYTNDIWLFKINSETKLQSINVSSVMGKKLFSLEFCTLQPCNQVCE